MIKKTLLTLVAATISTFTLLTSANAALEYGYDFVPTDSSSGVTGELFFKEAANASGTVSDLDAQSSYLGAGASPFSLGFGYFFIGDTITGPISQTGTLSWNSSTITSMDLSGATDFYLLGFLFVGGVDWEITDTSITADGISTPGAWDYAETITVAAPENTSTAPLLGLALIALGVCQFWQTRTRRA